MNAVVDASVLVASLIDAGPCGDWAEQILSAGSLYAPESARAETSNVLGRLERTNRITSSEANGAHEDLMRLNIEFLAFEPFAERIWELRHNLAGNEAWSVAAAEALRLPLATLDRRFVLVEGITCGLLTYTER